MNVGSRRAAAKRLFHVATRVRFMPVEKPKDKGEVHASGETQGQG